MEQPQQQQQQQPHPLPLHQLRAGSNNYNLTTGGGPSTAPPLINFDANMMSYNGVLHHGQSSDPRHSNYFPQQPPQPYLPPPPAPPAVGSWSTGLCGAHGEYWNCLVTHFCPWYTFGQIAEIVDQGTTSCCAASLLYLGVQCWFGCCFTPMVSYVYRARIRRKFNIPPGRCCGDFCLHFWCECFALRQVINANNIIDYGFFLLIRAISSQIVCMR